MGVIGSDFVEVEVGGIETGGVEVGRVALREAAVGGAAPWDDSGFTVPLFPLDDRAVAASGSWEAGSGEEPTGLGTAAAAIVLPV